MGYKGINLENVRNKNKSSILKLLNDNGFMSRKDIADELGLTPPSMTLICNELIQDGIITEEGEVEGEKKPGRKKVLLRLNYEYKKALSVVIEYEETVISLSDLKGNKVASHVIKTETDLDPDDFLKKIADECKVIMWENSVSREEILGIGVSVPGAVKRDEGISLLAIRIWNKPVNIAEKLHELTGFEVIVENNVKAFAEAELVYGNGRSAENLLFVKWGPGVGSAVIIDNKVYDSKNSNTAEIGHCIVTKNGKKCRCGKCGCLETEVSTHAITQQVKAVFGKETTPELYKLMGGDVTSVTAHNIEDWSKSDDVQYQEIIRKVTDKLAKIVSNTVTIIAPDKVIYYGYMFELPHFREMFLEAVSSYDSQIGEGFILKSELDDKQSYIGPLAVLTNQLFLMNDR